MTPPADQAPAGGEEALANSARSTVNISGELLAITRAAVRLVRARTGRAYSLRQFTEEAFATQIQTIAETYNDGRAIRPDDTPLEKGRSA
jgi:hypothetical protein